MLENRHVCDYFLGVSLDFPCVFAGGKFLGVVNLQPLCDFSSQWIVSPSMFLFFDVWDRRQRIAVSSGKMNKSARKESKKSKKTKWMEP